MEYPKNFTVIYYIQLGIAGYSKDATKVLRGRMCGMEAFNICKDGKKTETTIIIQPSSGRSLVICWFKWFLLLFSIANSIMLPRSTTMWLWCFSALMRHLLYKKRWSAWAAHILKQIVSGWESISSLAARLKYAHGKTWLVRTQSGWTRMASTSKPFDSLGLKAWG